MIVVADASPLNYLVLIGAVDLPQPLYTHVVVPKTVGAELSGTMAPPPSGLGSHSLIVADLSRTDSISRTGLSVILCEPGKGRRRRFCKAGANPVRGGNPDDVSSLR
jgi:hypothetical protein